MSCHEAANLDLSQPIETSGVVVGQLAALGRRCRTLREGPLTDPTGAAESQRWGRRKMPHSRHSRQQT